MSTFQIWIDIYLNHQSTLSAFAICGSQRAENLDFHVILWMDKDQQADDESASRELLSALKGSNSHWC